MFEYVLLILGMLIFILDTFLLNTVFLGFLGVWMLSSSILYFILSYFIISIEFNLGLSILLGLIPAYIYFRDITNKYKGMEEKGNFDDKKLFGIRSNKGEIKRVVDENKYIVDVDGVEWLAESIDKLDIGDKVKIEKMEGNLLIIRKDE